MRNARVAISEVADINPRLTADQRPDDKEIVSFVPMASVSEETLAIEKPIDRQYTDVARGFTPFRRGDILIAKITPCFENGKMAFAKNLPCRLGFGSTEFHVLRPKQNLDGAYLFHLLRAPFIRKAGEMKMKGAAGQRRVPADFFAQLQIPLPPLAEQKRIAAILDAADTLRAKRREAIAQLDSFLQSTFVDMFGDPVRNEKGWEVKKLEDWLENIDSGWSPKCLERKANNDEWGVLKLGAVTWCEFDENEQKALPLDLKPRSELEVKRGDLLFTRKNTYDLIAAVVYVHNVRPYLMLSDLIFRLRLKHDINIEPMFLWKLLIEQNQRQTIQKLAGGAAASMPNISKAKLKSVILIHPPLPLQHKFATIVESVERQKARMQAHLAELDALFASLQARAFNGEL
jgi:type I restriction enzyme, S subunit